MTRGLESALAAVRHDNKAMVMSAAEIEAHRVFLTRLGIARPEIDLTINVIHSTLRGDEVAMPDRIIPLMPATWVRDYVEGDRRQYERRPHLWSWGRNKSCSPRHVKAERRVNVTLREGFSLEAAMA